VGASHSKPLHKSKAAARPLPVQRCSTISAPHSLDVRRGEAGPVFLVALYRVNHRHVHMRRTHLLLHQHLPTHAKCHPAHKEQHERELRRQLVGERRSEYSAGTMHVSRPRGGPVAGKLSVKTPDHTKSRKLSQLLANAARSNQSRRTSFPVVPCARARCRHNTIMLARVLIRFASLKAHRLLEHLVEGKGALRRGDMAVLFSVRHHIRKDVVRRHNVIVAQALRLLWGACSRRFAGRTKSVYSSTR